MKSMCNNSTDAFQRNCSVRIPSSIPRGCMLVFQECLYVMLTNITINPPTLASSFLACVRPMELSTMLKVIDVIEIVKPDMF